MVPRTTAACNFLLCLLAFLLSYTHGDDPDEPTFQSILDSHDHVNDAPLRKYSDLNILGFLTPWNHRGKEVAVAEADRGRIDIASPVTYQVTPNGVVGGHDYEKPFYDDVMSKGASVMPRFLFEHTAWTLSDFQNLASSIELIAGKVWTVCQEHSFEGAVIEIWQTLMASGALSSSSADAMFSMVRSFGQSLRDRGLHTVLVLPPYVQDVASHGVNADSINSLSIGWSYFVVMTYDFTTPGASKPGPVAPVPWVRAVATYLSKSCGLRDKVLLGVNFYGVDFGPPGSGTDRHIVGHDVIALLQKHRPRIEWHKASGEHYFGYHDGGQRIAFYPSRRSIGDRLRIAEEVGCGGIAIWDMGQGLDHFFEEF